MMPIILTGLAGVALGLVIMRLLQAPPPSGAAPLDTATVTGDVARPATLSSFASRFTRNQMIFGGAGVLAALSLVAYAVRPSDTDSAGSTLAAPATTAAAGAALDDVDTMISRLAARLKTDTSDGEGFRMLGWSYVNTGHSAEAVTAYETAAKLLPGRADVHAGYGEAMVAVAKDRVTPEAKAQFDEAIRLDSKEPRARFFLSLYKSQNGKEREALDEWIALANGSASDLPWQVDLRQRITKLATSLGVDISGKLKAKAAEAAPSPFTPTGTGGPDAAAVTAAAKLPVAEQQGMINNMVDGLAAKLQANPDNIDGWVKLIRSRVVLKDVTRAKDDLAMARKAFSGNPAKLGQINALATELGL